MRTGTMRPPAEARYPNLSAPLQRGRLALKNRLMMMATVTNLGTNARITDAQVAFYVDRARGGVAAIVTEGMSVHPTSIPNPYVPLAFEPGLRSDLQRLADAVHAHDCAIYAQLWHVGRNALWNPSAVPWAPSPVRDPYSGSTPHAMTVAELNEVAEGFVATAELVRAAGFDGVELHGAHGYLITQTLSPWSNQRVDAYGGSLLNRTRFVREIINGIRDRTDARFVIGLKLSVDEFVSGGLTIEESARIIGILGDDAAPDYIGVSQANFSMPSLERHVPDMRFEPAPFLELARGVRDAAGAIPIVFMGRVTDAAHGESILAAGDADVIGMARALVADAQLPIKSFAGHEERVRPCVYCNVCWNAIHTQRPIACVCAPEVGREAELGRLSSVPSRRRRVVRVVGAGVAGLEAARIAAMRGHDVHVYDTLNVPGGQLSDAGMIPSREEFRRFVGFLVSEARRLGAQFHFSETIGADTAGSWLESDETVLLATGSVPVPPVVEGSEPLTLEAALERTSWSGTGIALIDEIEDEPTYSAAELLVSRGARVTLITRQPQIGRRLAYVSLIGVLRRLDSLDVTTVTLQEPVRLQARTLITRNLASGKERHVDDVDAVVVAGPYRSVDRLATELQARGFNPTILGDAYAPRRAMVAMLEGHRSALEL